MKFGRIVWFTITVTGRLFTCPWIRATAICTFLGSQWDFDTYKNTWIIWYFAIINSYNGNLWINLFINPPMRNRLKCRITRSLLLSERRESEDLPLWVPACLPKFSILCNANLYASVRVSSSSFNATGNGIRFDVTEFSELLVCEEDTNPCLPSPSTALSKARLLDIRVLLVFGDSLFKDTRSLHQIRGRKWSWLVDIRCTILQRTCSIRRIFVSLTFNSTSRE